MDPSSIKARKIDGSTVIVEKSEHGGSSDQRCGGAILNSAIPRPESAYSSQLRSQDITLPSRESDLDVLLS